MVERAVGGTVPFWKQSVTEVCDRSTKGSCSHDVWQSGTVGAGWVGGLLRPMLEPGGEASSFCLASPVSSADSLMSSAGRGTVIGSAPFLQSGDDGWIWSQELIHW